jgi:hypothetical protein
MKAGELVASLPEDATARSAALLGLVQAGHALELLWAPVIASLSDGKVPRWVATFQVSTDALQLGEPGDSFRGTFCDRDQIRICELLGLSRTTGKLADLAWLQSPVKLRAHTFSSTDAEVAVMDRKRVMVAHSQAIDAELRSIVGEDLTVAPNVLRRPVGKDWCASNANRPIPGGRKATNYGWHVRGPWEGWAVTLPGIGVGQPYAQKHDWTHTDYSQTATFVRPLVYLTDLTRATTEPIALADLNADPTLAKLWSHDGPIRENIPAAETTGSIAWVAYGALGLVTLAALAALIRGSKA